MTTPKTRIVAETYKIHAVSAGQSAPSTALVHWSEEDPAAVFFTIEDPWRSAGKSEPVIVDWCVSRYVLVAACMPGFRGRWVGLGDVAARRDDMTASLRLRSPDGEVQVVMLGDDLSSFLVRVARLMPVGSAEESEIYARAIDADWLAMAAEK